MTTNTKTTTYDELLARQQAMEAEIFGTPEKPETANPLAADDYTREFNDFLHGEKPTNALSAGRDGSGGYLVPDSLEQQLVKGLEAANVLRQISRVIKIDHDRKIPVLQAKGEAEWIDENTPVPDSDDTFGQIPLGAHKMVSSTKVSEELLEDAGFDLEKHIINSFAERFGDLEEQAFIDGTGSGMPLGLLNTAPVGAVTETAGEVTMDDMVDLLHSVPKQYREKAHWLLSEDLERKLRKIRSFNGRPAFEKALDGSGYDRLLGYPVLICKAMPSAAAGAKPALFGDFSYFWIADRGHPSFKRLEELYSATGQVGFRAAKRVDAKLTLPDAVKALQIKE
jgi:phage major capsid protein, HK97 family